MRGHHGPGIRGACHLGTAGGCWAAGAKAPGREVSWKAQPNPGSEPPLEARALPFPQGSALGPKWVGKGAHAQLLARTFFQALLSPPALSGCPLLTPPAPPTLTLPVPVPVDPGCRG